MKLKAFFSQIFAHIAIISSMMMLVFFVIDRMNPAISFMENEFHKWLAFVLLFSGGGSGICLLLQKRK